MSRTFVSNVPHPLSAVKSRRQTPRIPTSFTPKEILFANPAALWCALAANIAALAYIVYRAKKLGVNPYKQEAFVGTKDFQKAMERRADTAYLLETEPASATAAEIAEMVAYNELPAEGESGYVYVAVEKDEQ